MAESGFCGAQVEELPVHITALCSACVYMCSACVHVCTCVTTWLHLFQLLLQRGSGSQPFPVTYVPVTVRQSLEPW